MKNSTLVTRKCCYPTPHWHPIPMSGTPSPCLESHPHVWNPISCPELHPMSGTPFPCLESHLSSRTPSPCLEPHPHVWNPISCPELYPMSGTPSPCLEPHPQSGTASLVWNPIPTQCPHPTPIPSAPTLPSYPHPAILLPLPLPPSGPCCPCLAPNCPIPIWSGPRLSPSGTPIICHPPPAASPHPIKYHHQRSPPPQKEIWVFPSFPSFPMFVSISPCMGSILSHIIISFTSHGKNSQNSRAATPFPSIRYLYESPIIYIAIWKLFTIFPIKISNARSGGAR